MPFIKSVRRHYDQSQQGPKTSNFYDREGGDLVYTAGGYKIHMFTSVGDSKLKINLKPQFQNLPAQQQLNLTSGAGLTAEYLVVGGGGGAGARHAGGGGA